MLPSNLILKKKTLWITVFQFWGYLENRLLSAKRAIPNPMHHIVWEGQQQQQASTALLFIRWTGILIVGVIPVCTQFRDMKYHPAQIVAWIFILYFAIVYFGMIAPSMPTRWSVAYCGALHHLGEHIVVLLFSSFSFSFFCFCLEKYVLYGHPSGN